MTTAGYRVRGRATEVLRVAAADWSQPAGDGRVDVEALQAVVEGGGVLHLQGLPFALDADERRLLDPRIADPKRKNISLEPDGRGLRGVVGDAATLQRAAALIARFQRHAASLVDALCPGYRGRMRIAPASLRVHPVEGRVTSWRHDDSRLHIDAFPSRPLGGERILRVFLNLNPEGRPRVWRVGERFDDVARRFVPALPAPSPWRALLLHGMRVTKQRRTPYDALMLGLHDAMKADAAYQRDCTQQTLAFEPGSAWVCFSDQTSHAVIGGQHMLEQTFFLPVAAMAQPDLSPLRVLERQTGRALT